MSDTEGAALITVTLKYGKGYEDTWAVFKADTTTEVRARLMDYFGLTEDVVSGMTLHEVVHQATAIAHGNTVMGNVLGATIVPQGNDDGPRGAAAWGAAGAASEEPEEPKNPNAVLIERLNKAATVDELRALWARNQEAFEAEDVMEAYQARGRELTAA